MYHQIHTHQCIRHGVQTSSICFVIHLFIRLVIHLYRHSLFISMGRRKSGIQMRRDKESNRKRWHTCQSPTMTRQMDEMMLHILFEIFGQILLAIENLQKPLDFSTFIF